MTTHLNLLLLRRNPFIKLLIPFLFGIGISNFWTTKSNIGFVFVALLFLIIICLSIQKKWIRSYKTNYIFSGLSLLLLFIFGWSYSSYHKNILNRNFTQYYTPTSFITGRVSENIIEKENSFETVVDVTHITNGKKRHNTFGRIICYVSKQDNFKQLRIGDIIKFNTQLNTISPPSFPKEFNYKKYLIAKGITHSCYLKSKNSSVLGSEKSIFSIAQELRSNIIHNFKSAGLENENLAILSALFLGDKQALNKEIKQEFTSAGAMHVLAVSGLHVGIILYILTFLFNALFGKYRFKIMKTIGIVTLIWCFALLTGFSISVIRSAIMFSFVAIGSISGNKINIYNSIAASAFIILLIYPSALVDIGFQLSYIAVLGIIYFHPKINNLLYIKNKVLNHLWSITAVSIAAQIVTIPISLYYFHQIPVYSILTNLFVIYFAIVIISFGILSLTTMFVPSLFSLIIILLEKIISLLYYLINEVNKLPNATLNQLHLSNFQVCLLIGSIVLIIIYLERKKMISLYSFIGLLILFMIIEHFENYNFSKLQELIIYNTETKLTLNIVDNQQNIIYTSDTTEKRIHFLKKQLYNYWGSRDLHTPQIKYLSDKRNSIIRINKKKIYILNNHQLNESSSHYDYTLINNNNLNFSKVLNKLKTKEWILGNKLNKPTRERIIIENRDKKLNSIKGYCTIKIH